MNVLLVDDDVDLADSLLIYLGKHQIHVECVHNVESARSRIEARVFDAVLLDVMLPGQSGFDFLPTLREITSAPVLMLTALGEEDQRITGLNLGADDYLTKPFSAKELVARLRATYRRRAMLDRPDDSELLVDDLRLLPAQYSAVVGDRCVPLTGVECRILEQLMRATNRTLPRDTLYRRALGREESPFDRSLDVHISNLRRKLGAHAAKGSRIRAVRGVGYALIG